MQNRIERQKQKLAKGNPVIELSRACRANNGINILTEEEKNRYEQIFEKRRANLIVNYFIPASGSGSRMFDAFYSFIQNQNTAAISQKFISDFLKDKKQFAFFDLIPDEVISNLEQNKISIHDFIRFILLDKINLNDTEVLGLNLGTIPKGLIPFHKYSGSIYNAFQEHILHGLAISEKNAQFHFTIDSLFENQIIDSIQELKKLKGIDFNYKFSEQKKESNAIAFESNLEAIKDEHGNYITRPAGHGALLSNLNEINADLVFIRNIDNIQHQNNSQISVHSRKILAGILIELQEAIFEILHDIEIKTDYEEKILELNSKFDFRIPTNKISDANFIFDLLNRPIRICGMVKNEGQPGGGPFWVVDDSGYERRQIVEKSQMSDDPFQFSEMIKSTHFNPVELVCSFKNFKGEKFDLNDFKNDDLYFIVNKTHQGKPIKYIEEPGLWNGGMEKWTTLFYEIDSDCFSPVKTVLDLLGRLHQE